MSRSRQILINAVAQWAVTGLSAILGLLIVPFLILKLGQDGYGLVVIILGIAGICALADMGISGALARQLAESLGRKDNDAFNEYASTASIINLAVGGACALSVLLLAVPMARAFRLPEALFRDGVILLRTFGAAHVLLTFAMFTPRAVLASHNRFDLACVIDAARRLMQTVGLFVVLSLTSLGLVGWALVCILVDTAVAGLLWRAAFRAERRLRISQRWFRRGRVRSLYGLGGHLTVLQVSGQLSVSADPFILTACLGPASVSFYRPPSQAMGAISQLVMTLAGQLHPLATQAHVQGDRESLKRILFQGTKFTMLMGSVACAIVISLAEPLCKVWLGGALGEGYKTAAAVLTIQAVTALGAFAAGTQWPVLLGMRKTAFAAYGRLALALVNIAASWLLVRYARLGVIGVVIPTMVIELVWRPVLGWYVCRAVAFSVREYLQDAYLAPLMIGSAVAGLGLQLRVLAPVKDPWSLALMASILGGASAALIWFAGLSGAERKKVRGALQPLAAHPTAVARLG